MDQQNLAGERSGRPAFVEEKADSLYWLGALVLTLAVRLYLFFNYYTINNDGVLYIEAARNFLEGRWSDGLASFYPPLFPLMIAGAYPLVHDWELAGQIWPFILGVLTLFPLFGLFRRVYGFRVAHAALFLYAVSPYLARLSLEVRTEIPYVFFAVLALYFLQRGLDSGSLLSFFFTGICSALAYLVRPEGIGLIMVGVLFLLYRGWIVRRLEKSGLKAAVLALGFVMFSAPYVLYLRWDTGTWMVSRKTGLILSMALARHAADSERVTMKDSDQVSIVRFIVSRPLTYFKKVFIDSFRSLGFYFEALHYSYLPFLFIGWYFFFRQRFWEKGDFLLMGLVFFYLAVFSLLYVTRRYGIPLAAVSLGWVGAGYLAVEEYFCGRWRRRGYLLTGLVLILFAVGTLPKTLQAIGWDKFYLREAGVYLKEKDGNPTILTTNGRVAFYAAGKNRVRIVDPKDLGVSLARQEGDFLAMDEKTQKKLDESLEQSGWLLEREFSSGGKEGLFVFRRVRA